MALIPLFFIFLGVVNFLVDYKEEKKLAVHFALMAAGFVATICVILHCSLYGMY